MNKKLSVEELNIGKEFIDNKISVKKIQPILGTALTCAICSYKDLNKN